MNIETENKELNLLNPLINIVNSILSLNLQHLFKNSNDSEENREQNILHSFNDDIKYCFKVLILD